MRHYKRHNCISKCHIVQQTKLENPVVTKLIALELRVKAIIKPVQPIVKSVYQKDINVVLANYHKYIRSYYVSRTTTTS
jgi:hypothetical protein